MPSQGPPGNLLWDHEQLGEGLAEELAGEEVEQDVDEDLALFLVLDLCRHVAVPRLLLIFLQLGLGLGLGLGLSSSSSWNLSFTVPWTASSSFRRENALFAMASSLECLLMSLRVPSVDSETMSR